MKIRDIRTPEELAAFLKADRYWFEGMDGRPDSLPRDELVFHVRTDEAGRLAVSATCVVMFVGLLSDLTDEPPAKPAVPGPVGENASPGV